jgi:hypothetical protein
MRNGCGATGCWGKLMLEAHDTQWKPTFYSERFIGNNLRESDFVSGPFDGFNFPMEPETNAPTIEDERTSGSHDAHAETSA